MRICKIILKTIERVKKIIFKHFGSLDRAYTAYISYFKMCIHVYVYMLI